MSESNGAMQVTPASEFRQVWEEGVLQQLPSGRVVRLRPVSIENLMREGKVPDILTPLAIRIMYGEAQQEEFNAFLDPREDQKEALAVGESLRVVCAASLMEPVIVDKPQADGEIHINNLSYADKTLIFNLAFLEADALKRFRFRQAPDVEPVGQSEGDPPAAEPVGADSK